METKTSAKFVKYLLILQILTVIGVGICEVIQLAEFDSTQETIINHPEDWYLIGYTTNIRTIWDKVYYWVAILVSIAVLGRSLKSFEKRWENIQEYSDNSKNMWLLALWCIAIISRIAILSALNGIRTCSKSSYTYQVAQNLLNYCNAYLASLLLAYVLVLLVVIQLLFHFIVIKHLKKLSMTQHIKQQPVMEGPKLTRVRRSKRVNRRRNSFLSNNTRLSMVAEHDEERSIKSDKSNKSGRSVRINNTNDQNVHNSEFDDEKRVHSNV